MSDSDERLYFNGIDGRTGQYLLPPMRPAELVARFIAPPPAQPGQDARAQAQPELPELRYRQRRRTQGTLGVAEGIDPTDLAQAGWGVIFAAGDPQAAQIKDALAPLLKLRRSQAGPHYREYLDGDGLKPNESKTAFLTRHQTGPGPADPRDGGAPYYLLLVGGPEHIPYSFQYQLDVQYAVGRIHFDSIDEYRRYAESVVLAASAELTLPRRAALFGTEHPGDPATAMSAQRLVTPLARHLRSRFDTWSVETTLADAATKAQLSRLLGGSETPALLFTAGHGMGFGLAELAGQQLRRQGALLCGNWPGPGYAIGPEHYLAADDIDDDARLLGLIAFQFGCFGAGTPEYDDFAFVVADQRQRLAPRPLIAALPQRLLGHPNGGALAVIGHVERAFPCSFIWGGAGTQTGAFTSGLEAIMAGKPVGHALEYFNERYSELATVFSEKLAALHGGSTASDDQELAGMWMANNDARNYVIFGDPAVRLPALSDAPATPRPALALSTAGASGSPAAPSGPAASQPAGQGSSSVYAGIAGMAGYAPPPPAVPPAYKEQHKELYDAWVKHVKAGYTNSDDLFAKILRAFLFSHYSSVAMYWIMFLLGIGLLITAAVLGVVRGQDVTALIFGGVGGAVAFVTYFIGRSAQSIEENLLHITWLGVLYNSYWTRLNWSYDPKTAQAELDKATENAVAQIKEVIASHAERVRQRSGLAGGGGQTPGGDGQVPGGPPADAEVKP